MAITTIKDFTAAVAADDATAVQTASLELTAASVAAGTAKAAVDAAARAVEGHASTITATRAQMAAAPTATEALAIAESLLQLEIVLHELGAKLTAAQHTAALANARVARASAAEARSKEALAASTAADKAAGDEATAWQQNVAPAIAALRARAPAISVAAADLEAQAVYLEAEDRVELDVPQPLRTQARNRVAVLQNPANQAVADTLAAETVVAAAHGTHFGKSGAIVVKRLDYQRKRRRLRALADAERQLADIIATLKAIKSAPADSAGTLGRLATAQTAAALALQARDDAKADVDAKQAEIDAKQIEIDNEPPGPAQDVLLQDKQDLVDEKALLVPTLAAAETTLVAANNVAEDSVSEDAWRRLHAFDAAVRQLAALKALTVAVIDQTIAEAAAAETALAVAMKEESDARRLIATAEATVAVNRDAESATREHAEAQLVAALRGDV